MRSQLAAIIASLLFAANGCSGLTTGELLDATGLLSDVTAPAILSPAPSGGGRAPNLATKLIWATKIPAKYYEVEVTSDSAFQNPISGSSPLANAAGYSISAYEQD